MKKPGFKLLPLLLALVMALSLTGALAQTSGELKILTNVTGGKDDAEMVLFQEALGQAVGLTVTMEKPAANYGDVVMQKLGAGEVYDLIYLNAPQMFYLQEQGALTDLTDYVTASPILSDTAVIPADEWDQVKVDGRIYAGFNKTEVHRLVNINKAVAKAAGIDVDAIEPTLDGYYEVFKKMKEVGGEGFYGLNAVIKDAWDLQPWFASAGLKAGQVVAEDGSVSVPYASEEAIPVWEWLAKLYAEGLLDPDSLTGSSGDMRGKFNTGKTAVVVDWAAWTGLYNLNAGEAFPEQFEAYPLPGTQTPDGGYMLARGDASIWVVPANAANVEGAVKVLEFFATQEGGELLSLGIEGHDYNRDAEGKVIFTEVGLSHNKDHGAPFPVSRQYVDPIGFPPNVELAMSYLPHASIQHSDALTDMYRQIVAKYGTQIVNGTMSGAEGVAAMQEELKAEGVIK